MKESPIFQPIWMRFKSLSDVNGLPSKDVSEQGAPFVLRISDKFIDNCMVVMIQKYEINVLPGSCLSVHEALSTS